MSFTNAEATMKGGSGLKIKGGKWGKSKAAEKLSSAGGNKKAPK